MYKNIRKDKTKRLHLFINEAPIKLLKTVLTNQRLHHYFKEFILLILDVKKGNYASQIRNFCVRTGRSKGVISKFGLSRLALSRSIGGANFRSFRQAIW